MRNFQVNQQGFFAVITKCLLMLALTHKLVITKHVLSPIYSIVYILYRPTEIEIFSKKSLHCFMLEMRTLAVSMTPGLYKLVIFYCLDIMFE